AIVEALAGGASIALVSDAGTPAVSDPGAQLVRAVRASGYPVVPIPGASALIAAVSAAGVEGPFLFLGFLPARGGPRRATLEPYVQATHALVLYEAPHRVVETIDDLLTEFGAARRIVIARELTKRFETITEMPLGDVPAWLAADANRIRGEFVLVVAPAPHVVSDEGTLELDRVLAPLLAELPLKQAVSLAVAITGLKKNSVYTRALGLKNATEPNE
ncbi:MAG: 16S rRNA (cytidine(1402)-2'-O)-methyltransferase, partial [Burkholderiales bacterium]